MKRLTVVGFAALLLTGCALFPGSDSAAQKAYTAERLYADGVAVSLQYESLPRCGVVAICSDPKAVKTIRDADNIAKVIVDAAEFAARSSWFPVTGIPTDAEWDALHSRISDLRLKLHSDII